MTFFQWTLASCSTSPSTSLTSFWSRQWVCRDPRPTSYRKFDVFSVNLVWVCTLKVQWDWVHPSLINTDKWWHSISLRLTFMSGAQIDGKKKWISASSLVSSFCFWVLEFPNVSHCWEGQQIASVVTSVLKMGNQGCERDHLNVTIFLKTFHLIFLLCSLWWFRLVTALLHHGCNYVYVSVQLTYPSC